MKKLALKAIRLYQLLISPFLPRCCRFYPSCSQYTYQAIARFGLLRGGLLGLWRLLRCQPFSAGGYDPLPQKFPWFKNVRRPKGVPLWKRT